MNACRPLLASLVASVAIAVPAHGAGKIQPGAEALSEVGGCTFGFAFEGTGAQVGKSYLSLAEHCVEQTGVRVTDGGGDLVGTVVFVGGDEMVRDFALVEIAGPRVGDLSGEMRGHPGVPTRVATPDLTAGGDAVQLSGYGLGFGFTAPTRERRSGVLSGDDARAWHAVAPAIWGDSGGPVLHIPSGGALGITSQLCIGGCSVQGPTVANLIADAGAHGFGIRLKTATGVAARAAKRRAAAFVKRRAAERRRAPQRRR